MSALDCRDVRVALGCFLFSQPDCQKACTISRKAPVGAEPPGGNQISFGFIPPSDVLQSAAKQKGSADVPPIQVQIPPAFRNGDALQIQQEKLFLFLQMVNSIAWLLSRHLTEL